MKNRLEAQMLAHTDSEEGGEETATMERKSLSIKIFGRSVNYVVALVHFNIAMYAACFWIQTGTLPYLTKKLGVNTVVFGYLQTTFAVMQLAGGPLYGRFGDLYGGRAALVLAFVSSTMTYGTLGFAYSIPVLFFSRAMSVFMHAMQGGQMVVTDMSSSEQRADALGKLGLSYGVGMVVGSLTGGQITKHLSEQSAAFAAAAGCLFAIFICFVFVPQRTKRPEIRIDSKSSVFNVKELLGLCGKRETLRLLVVRIVSGIPIGVFQSMFSVVAIDQFKLSPEVNGYLMSYIGVISMLVQGVGISFLLKIWTEMRVIKLSAFILIWSYLLLVCVDDAPTDASAITDEL